VQDIEYLQGIGKIVRNKEEKMVAGPLPLQNRGPGSFSGRKNKKRFVFEGSFLKVRF
jgi:hypothetical protein